MGRWQLQLFCYLEPIYFGTNMIKNSFRIKQKNQRIIKSFFRSSDSVNSIKTIETIAIWLVFQRNRYCSVIAQKFSPELFDCLIFDLCTINNCYQNSLFSNKAFLNFRQQNEFRPSIDNLTRILIFRLNQGCN